MNSKIALYILVLALIGIAFYVVRTKERRRHDEASAAGAAESAPARAAKSADPREPPPARRPRN